MTFKYSNGMPYTYAVGDAVHQLDPLSMVPSADTPDVLAPLYEVIGMTEEAALAVSMEWRLQQVRKERDARISETDWWVLYDRTPTQAQIDYRQALRDITQGFDPRVDVVWPTKP